MKERGRAAGERRETYASNSQRQQVANDLRKLISEMIEKHEMALSMKKVLLTKFPSLLPLFQQSANVVEDLLIARDKYELAIVLSVKAEDQEAFERDLFQLKPFYTDTCSVDAFPTEIAISIFSSLPYNLNKILLPLSGSSSSLRVFVATNARTCLI